MPVEIDQIVPWGRTFDEYVRMFALSEADLRGAILDCAAGPSSFNAAMRRRGQRVVSADPIFETAPAAIRARVGEVRGSMIRQVHSMPEQFSWEYVRSPEHLERLRMGAMEEFLADYSDDGSRDRYRPQSLPRLGFSDGAFDLALCSHFLFLYSDRLDLPFHLASVDELLRVAREVRVFPVTDLAGRHSDHLPAVLERFDARLVRVEYEFLRGANEMLVIRGRAVRASVAPEVSASAIPP